MAEQNDNHGTGKQMKSWQIVAPLFLVLAIFGGYFWPALLGPSVPRRGEFAGLFLVNGDGTITDLQTNLTWQRTIRETDGGWRTTSEPEGAYFCYAEYCGWRVPTLDELEGLHAHIIEARSRWTAETCGGEGITAGLARLCCSGSWWCFNSMDNPFTHSLAPFRRLDRPILAAEVDNWTEGCESGSSPEIMCEYWQFIEFDVEMGTYETVTLTMGYVNGDAVSPYSSHDLPSYDWAWLLVRP